MNFKNVSRTRGTRRAICGLLLTTVIYSQTGQADTIFSVNGVDVDSAVVDLYFDSRLGGQNNQATPEQREILMTELRDIYVLSLIHI